MTADVASTEAIAAEISKAYQESPETANDVAGAYYAPMIDMRHEPAQPGRDGVVDRETVIAQYAPAMAMLKQVIPNFAYSGTVSSSGNLIKIQAAMTGTQSDGTPLELAVPMTYTVENGEIVSVVIEEDPEGLKALAAALTSGGVDIPDFS